MNKIKCEKKEDNGKLRGYAESQGCEGMNLWMLDSPIEHRWHPFRLQLSLSFFPNESVANGQRDATSKTTIWL